MAETCDTLVCDRRSINKFVHVDRADAPLRAEVMAAAFAASPELGGLKQQCRSPRYPRRAPAE
jgi:hypothetical protein